MTRHELAAKLNGRLYGSEMTRVEEAQARAEGLLVVFGASDDLTEYRGLIHDEGSAFDGNTHFITGSPGKWKLWETDEDRTDARKPKGVAIEVIWCPDDLKTSWLIKPSVPFAPFDIMEDGDLYCRGAVIAEADLLPAQRILAVERYDKSQYEVLITLTEPLTDADFKSIQDHLAEWSR
jgi:hypothetical protein